MPKVKRTNSQPARLQEALVLHKYILNLFGCKDLEALSRDLKDPALEGVDDEGTSRFYYVLKQHQYDLHISQEKLFEYDKNIVRHTKDINEHRPEKIQWKYYQYLALLFTEIYLDRYFADKEKLRSDINSFLADDFNFRTETWHGMDDFKEEDMNKLAYWCATGSGKTLMMHINIKQYLHYAEKYHAKKLNRILILTPNEGLSSQHLQELYLSNFSAELFSKQGRGGAFAGKTIEVIDINKLADTDGDKTVAVESFEGNNLVLVDEGHKGSGGEVWKGYRNTLTQEGFSFEYSATFGQAIAAQTGANRDALLKEYGKATLFDYSYRYFYNDGYGKDYRIMNMASWDDEELLRMYLTAYLLCLYEQTLVYISPVALNVGETSFVKAIRDFYEKHKNEKLQGKEIYLLRNESRKGIGFFEASGFNDPDISLDSYIISNTPYNDEIFRWGERSKFLENHVLFDYDEEYVKTLFG